MSLYEKKYDAIIIGTGAAGSKIAYGLSKERWKVAIIDKRPFGGTCSQRGCDPKKILNGAAQIVKSSQLMKGSGIRKQAYIVWDDLVKFKDTFTDPIPANTKKAFEKKGIHYYSGTAKFVSKSKISINKKNITANYFIIAAGQKPVKLNIPGEEHIKISDDFFDLIKLPKELIFIGGGYISFEFAYIASMAGSNVTILQRGNSVLNNFDHGLTTLLLKNCKEDNIKIIYNVNVKTVIRKNSKFELEYEIDNKKHKILAGCIFNTAGRKADIDELDTETAGIKINVKGIVVNDQLQSISNPTVYSAGDSASNLKLIPLTPEATMAAGIVLNNLLHKKKQKIKKYPVPSAVYTIPPLASVGLTEDKALKSNIKVKIKVGNTSDFFSSKRLKLKNTGYKIIFDEHHKKILGAHVYGHNSDEVINLFSIFIERKIPVEEIQKFIFAYPTYSSDINTMIKPDIKK